MNVGIVVRETIQLQRAYACEHKWVPLNETEEQCSRCSIIATPEGKTYLARIADRFRPKPVPHGG